MGYYEQFDNKIEEIFNKYYRDEYNIEDIYEIFEEINMSDEERNRITEVVYYVSQYYFVKSLESRILDKIKREIRKK